MDRFGGQYLEPNVFFSEKYKPDDFRNLEFWNSEGGSWGKIVHTFLHSSKFYTKKNRKTFDVTEPIYISVDGLISCKLYSKVSTDEEALNFFIIHINSFLATLSFGGIFCIPLTDQQIYTIRYNSDKDEITLGAGGGSDFYKNDFRKLIQRHKAPTIMDTKIIDFNISPDRIIKKQVVETVYENGKRLLAELDFKNNEQIIALEVYASYGYNKWTNVLILGWTFIEILLDKLWYKKIILSVNENEINRKKRLKDVKSYSAAIRTEALYLKQIISLESYNSLNKLRKLRNDFVHNGEIILKEDVDSVFSVSSYLIKELTNTEFYFRSPGWSRTGGWVDTIVI